MAGLGLILNWFAIYLGLLFFFGGGGRFGFEVSLHVALGLGFSFLRVCHGFV